MDYLLTEHFVATFYDVAVRNSSEKYGQSFLAPGNPPLS